MDHMVIQVIIEFPSYIEGIKEDVFIYFNHHRCLVECKAGGGE